MGERKIIEIDERGVRGFLHEAAGENGLVLTHGAGANCRSPLLVTLADAFCGVGVTVLRYDLPFRQERPKGPPLRSAERDQQGVALAVEWMKGKVRGRVFAGGHSYGGRQTSMMAATNPEMAEGLLLLSYPLHPPNRPTQMRTGHFPEWQTPALFVQGARDGFGTQDEMREALQLIPAATRLLMVDGAGHELLTKANHGSLTQTILSEFRELFLAR